MGAAAHGEHAWLRGARRESLRVIQVACAEAQCAQRRGALALGRPRERLKMATGNYFDFRPSSTFGPRAADDALLLRLQRTGVRSNRRGHVGGLDQQER